MKVTLLTLCDRATVREGLLHILGAGINMLGRPNLPAALAVDLAVILESESLEELPGEHQVLVTIRDDSDNLVARADVQWSLVAQVEQVDPPPYVPFSIPLQNVAVPSHGFYEITLALDGQQLAGLRFLVAKELQSGATAMLPAGPSSPA